MRILSILLAAAVVAAQSAAFEAASIRPNTSGPGASSMRVTEGRGSMQNVSLTPYPTTKSSVSALVKQQLLR
jgi:hypothetical protein